MITFVTLFLGLVTGVQTVEVLPGDEVAAVEILLDGEAVGRMTEAPWRLEVDLGPELLPHELEAVAYDADGSELARTRQGINVPRATAEVGVVLETSEDGRRFAHVTWQSVLGSRPESLELHLDGEPVEVPSPPPPDGRVELPDHDLSEIHFLRASVRFPGDVGAATEVAFGGRFGSRVEGELTALPLFLERRRAPDLEDLRGRIVDAAGRPIPVLAVEEPTAEAVLVVAREALVELRRDFAESLGDGVELPTSPQKRGTVLTARSDPRYLARLGRDHGLRILWPVAATRRGERQAFDLFPHVGPYPPERGGVPALVLEAEAALWSPDRQRLADAVAAAGMGVAGRGRRRAVVLLTTADAADASRLSTDAVRRYLEEIRVPLRVWSFDDERPAAWPEAEVVPRVERFERVAKSLRRILDRQRLVWIEGRHLPREVRLEGDLRAALVWDGSR